MHSGILSFGYLAPLILAVYLVCISLEMMADSILKRGWYKTDDTIANLVMFFINRLTGVAAGTFMLVLLGVAHHLSPLRIDGAPGAVITFLIVDFLFYVQHKCFHANDFLAAFHEVHHSSQHYNLTTTLRASFMLPLINPFFYLPAAVIGCDPLAIVLSFTFIQVYQFFLHTQSIPALGIFEGYLNTPSAHRVHHSQEREHYKSNLGGIFLVWDRIWDTYCPEPEVLKFGVKGVEHENFWVAQIRPFVSMVTRSQNRKRA